MGSSIYILAAQGWEWREMPTLLIPQRRRRVKCVPHVTDIADNILAHIYLFSTQLAIFSNTTAISVLASNLAIAIPCNKHNGSPQTRNESVIVGGVVVAARFFPQHRKRQLSPQLTEPGRFGMYSEYQ